VQTASYRLKVVLTSADDIITHLPHWLTFFLSLSLFYLVLLLAVGMEICHMSGSKSRLPGGSCYLAWFLPSRCCKSCTKRIRANTVFNCVCLYDSWIKTKVINWDFWHQNLHWKKIFSWFVITTFFFCQINLNNLYSSDNIISWVSDD